MGMTVYYFEKYVTNSHRSRGMIIGAYLTNGNPQKTPKLHNLIIITGSATSSLRLA